MSPSGVTQKDLRLQNANAGSERYTEGAALKGHRLGVFYLRVGTSAGSFVGTNCLGSFGSDGCLLTIRGFFVRTHRYCKDNCGCVIHFPRTLPTITFPPETIEAVQVQQLCTSNEAHS